LDVSTFPVVLGATNCTLLVPLPKITLFSVNVVSPVPPLAAGTAPVKLVPAAAWPDAFTLFAKSARLNACVITLPLS
jgi:hypothetical protein